ncbi:EF-hand domain-containing protein [Sedimenticola hydrogenitrophicus]|uniref:EF-hand domain-containing protein n=1 Tax=Sedimenticola hydrogenitrophicus TaxID=2967975 RepID=UPI0021A85568|nr:EF-hand domain-containing protein [Sedimenticola hydrogenitrophicus]
MTKKIMTALFAALAAAAVIAAESQTDVALDTDNNGSLSQEEAKAIPGLIEQWDALDVNRDGQLDPAEFASFVAVETKAPAN